MSTGAEPLASANAKLRWARSRHNEMQQRFAAFALPDDPDARPYGIKFDARGKPAGLVVATFILEQPMPEDLSLLAADLVHNTRVALDHTLARLKERFGGNPGRGSFPICSTQVNWVERVGRDARGLGSAAVDFIYSVQPLHADEPESDPLLVLNRLDNDDKHRLMHLSYVYPGCETTTGLDLIEIAQPSRVRATQNRWTSGEPLEHGTPLATFMVRNPEAGVLRARTDARIGFATGSLDTGRTQFTTMIERVQLIVDQAAALIDADRTPHRLIDGL
jgi:hypothetical protein